jgi:hypothetical protein
MLLVELLLRQHLDELRPLRYQLPCVLAADFSRHVPSSFRVSDWNEGPRGHARWIERRITVVLVPRESSPTGDGAGRGRGRPSSDSDANHLQRICLVDVGPLGGPNRVSGAEDVVDQGPLGEPERVD